MARDRAKRPEAKALRLFVAFEIPEEVRRKLADAVEPLRERFPRGRWVPLANQHVTLKFLGATWPRLVGWVEETVRAVAASRAAFEIRVGGLGAFPSERRARVLWAGLEEDGSVGRLAAGLEDALAREFRPEARAFTPHLTLARFEPAERLTDLPALPALESFVVERIVLFRSHLRRPAPIYEPIRTFELGAD